MNKKLKVVLSGGGTGGHIFPLLPLQMRSEKDFRIQNFCS